MENNTKNINVQTGEVTHSYTEQVPFEPVQIDYDAEVHKLIRLKYSQSQEFSILRQQVIKPDEYQEYFDYCETCKMQVKEMIENHS